MPASKSPNNTTLPSLREASIECQTNTLYTNRDFMEKAKRFSSEECSLLMNLSNAFPTATLIVVD